MNPDALHAVPVLLTEFRTLHLVLVGCGGNGSWMAESIARLAYILKLRGVNADVTFYDADTVQPENIPRQRFYPAELGLNKAVALAARYNLRYGLRIEARPSRYQAIKPKDWYHTVLTILVGCVDNHEGRQALHDSLCDERPTVWWLDLGNHAAAGQVLLGCQREVEGLLSAAFRLETLCTRLPAPGLIHPELLVPMQRSPTESKPEGCAQLDIQGLTVNQMTSAIATDYLHRLFSGKLTRWATYFDQSTGTSSSLYITPRNIAAAIRKPG